MDGPGADDSGVSFQGILDDHEQTLQVSIGIAGLIQANPPKQCRKPIKSLGLLQPVSVRQGVHRVCTKEQEEELLKPVSLGKSYHPALKYRSSRSLIDPLPLSIVKRSNGGKPQAEPLKRMTLQSVPKQFPHVNKLLQPVESNKQATSSQKEKAGFELIKPLTFISPTQRPRDYPSLLQPVKISRSTVINPYTTDSSKLVVPLSITAGGKRCKENDPSDLMAPLKIGNRHKNLSNSANDTLSYARHDSTGNKTCNKAPAVSLLKSMDLSIHQSTDNVDQVAAFLKSLDSQKVSAGSSLFERNGKLHIPGRLSRYLKLFVGKSDASVLRRKPYFHKTPVEEMVYKYSGRPDYEIKRLGRYIDNNKRKRLRKMMVQAKRKRQRQASRSRNLIKHQPNLTSGQALNFSIRVLEATNSTNNSFRLVIPPGKRAEFIKVSGKQGVTVLVNLTDVAPHLNASNGSTTVLTIKQRNNSSAISLARRKQSPKKPKTDNALKKTVLKTRDVTVSKKTSILTLSSQSEMVEHIKQERTRRQEELETTLHLYEMKGEALRSQHRKSSSKPLLV